VAWRVWDWDVKTILFAEDDSTLLENVAQILQYEGFRVLTAADGLEALAWLERETPDLVIADILMPKLDGYSLVEHLRARPTTAGVPVIFLTASKQPINGENELASSANARVIKPFNTNELLEVIAALLG
jgi:CheY-like chemotaxis protein